MATSTVLFDVSSPLVDTPWALEGSMTITELTREFNDTRAVCDGWFKYQSSPNSSGQHSTESFALIPALGYGGAIVGDSSQGLGEEKLLTATVQFDDPDPGASFTCNTIHYDLLDSYV